MDSIEISDQKSEAAVNKVLAKIAPFLASAPIFSLTEAPETKAFRHITRHGKDSIAITGQLLGPMEQALLLQIIATAGTTGKRLLRKNRDGSSSLYWETLFPYSWGAPVGVGEVIFVRVARLELLRAAGLPDCWDSIRTLFVSLSRIAEVEVNFNIKAGNLTSKLLVYGTDETDCVSVALNPCLGAAACLGGRYRGVSLDERQLLVTQQARLIHAWLSAVLWPGYKDTFNARSLAFAIWPEQNTKHGELCPAELETVGLAHVLELRNCGWAVTVDCNSATIWRPRLELVPKYGVQLPFHPDYKAPRRRPVGRVSELDIFSD